MNIHELFALVSHDYEHVEKWDSQEFWDHINFDKGEDLAHKLYFGDYNPNHYYVGYDGYANIESMSADDYEAELLSYAGEFITHAYSAGDIDEEQAQELAEAFDVEVDI